MLYEVITSVFRSWQTRLRQGGVDGVIWGGLEHGDSRALIGAFAHKPRSYNFV